MTVLRSPDIFSNL